MVSSAELTIDLNDELNFGFDEERFIQLGPPLFAEKFFFFKNGVDLFGQMRSKGAEELQKGEEKILGDFLGSPQGSFPRLSEAPQPLCSASDRRDQLHS